MTNEFEYTLCVLASAAYDQTAQTTLGFKVLATFGDPSTAGGFYAVAFFDDDDNDGVCDNGERIIVSFRGTDVGTSLDDAAADLAIGLPTAAWHSQFNQAISTVLGLRQSHQASEILVTGHSLGGSLAQVAAHAFSLGGAAFDPGGAANLVASSDYQTLMTSLDADPQNDGISFGQGPSSDFRNFFVIGSFVSGSSGAHIGSNSVTLDFATQAQGNVVAVTVSGVNRFFDVLGTEATWLAEAVVNFLPTFVYHGIGGIRSLMSIRAGGAFDTASDLYAQIANITNYASTTGNIGFDSPPGSAVNPTYTLSASRPILIADNGDNQINGTSGNDTIYALGGDDIINSGTGVDRVDGGAGFDTVSADQSTASAVIIWNLLTNSYSGPGSYSAIERFGTLRTGSGNDRITTADFGVRDNIFTGAGDDVVTLDGGGDYAMGGEGDDTLELDFSWRSGSVTVRTTAPPLQVFGVPGGSANAAGMVQAYFAEFENYTISTGSGNDYIRTDAGHDEIRAGDGNDDIGAGAGDDFIDGGDGNDTINSGSGNDTVAGGLGLDAVAQDWSSESSAINWNLRTGDFNGPGHWTGFERFGTLQTGSGNDRITTASLWVSDTIFAGSGDDVVTLDGGGDNAMGGEGTDTLELDFAERAGSVTIITSQPPLQVYGVPGGSASTAGAVQAYFAEFENYTISTGSGNDYIRTDAGHDEIRAGDGNDDIGAGAGDDFIDGGSGADRLSGGPGVNTLIGGTGNDRLEVEADGSGSLVEGGADFDILVVSGAVSLGSLTGIETLEFASGAALTLTGAQFANGLAVNAAVTGSGALIVNMNAGTSFFATQMSFAAGIALTVNGTGGVDVIKGALGAAMLANGGDGADQIRTGNLVDTIDGGAGNDKIMGLGGADLLTGGAGADQFRYLFAADSGLGSAADRILDFTNGEDKLDFRVLDANPNIAGRQALSFIGTAAFATNGTAQLRYADSGADTLIQIDLNGDGAADMEIVLAGHAGQALTGTDFLF